MGVAPDRSLLCKDYVRLASAPAFARLQKDVPLEVCKRLGSVGYNPNISISHLYIGYDPFISHLYIVGYDPFIPIY